MRVNQLVIAALLTVTGGCTPFMKLPPPDPIWAATAGSPGGQAQMASLEQKAATERARAYITKSLPAHSDDFIRNLEQQSFFCSVHGDALYECIYSKAQPRVPCATSLRVSVQLDFPYEPERPITISKDDIDVAAFVVGDGSHIDNRGCFPL
jgi:hypothetical protein